ncbi:MAG TPA: hypothetical protein VKM55_07570 [Candidatus Lokiarchaeia archaeon]|nr:hypothetical protein [Candidatus Lokiarchaeia archaeon]
MKRFSSIDFLRGTAIVMMLFLHQLSWFLNAQAILDDINNAPLINLLALVIFEFMGGLAGFFLLVSAIGNMISMYKRLQSGRSADDLLRSQIVTGILLVIFAYLVEGDIGYLGALGNFFHSLNTLPVALSNLPNFYTSWAGYADTMFSRWAHFETIHTIAWCLLINGIIQYILSRNERWKNIKNQVIAYAVLAIIMVAITQPVWMWANAAVPGGYPWNLTTGALVSEPDILLPGMTFLNVLQSVFLNVLVAPEEPVLPYLAVSFIGSIIGIVICQPREKVPLNFPKRMMQIAMAMFLVGVVGVIVFVVSILTGPGGFKSAVDAYRQISYHRSWYDYPGIPSTFTFPLPWLWQFLALNGMGILLTMLVIRLVEFRGYGAGFAKKTTFVRRFGFTAFTNYNNQWYLWIVQYLFAVVVVSTGLQGLVGTTLPPGHDLSTDPYTQVNWPSVFILLILVFCFYHVILILWEKVGYVGTLEWAIGTIAYGLIPSKRLSGSRLAGKKWYQKGQLDVKNAFYNAEWQNIVNEGDIPPEQLKDSKLSYKLALIGFVSLLFMPVCLVTWRISIAAERVEGKNKYNHIAKIVSIIGMCITFVVLGSLFILTPNLLGIPF